MHEFDGEGNFLCTYKKLILVCYPTNPLNFKVILMKNIIPKDINLFILKAQIKVYRQILIISSIVLQLITLNFNIEFNLNESHDII